MLVNTAEYYRYPYNLKKRRQQLIVERGEVQKCNTNFK